MKSHLDSDQSKAILAGLMDEGRADVGYWSPADLRAVLEHQLRTPLRLEADRLAEHAGAAGEAARSLVEVGPYETFGDVLERGTPADLALAVVKSYAKAMMRDGDGLPQPVAHFLYVAAVLRARSLGDETISTLDPVALQSEARRCLSLQWLPDRAREILRASLGR